LIGTTYQVRETKDQVQTPQTGFNCWTFVAHAYEQAGSKLRDDLIYVRSLWRGTDVGIEVKIDDLDPGDIVLLRSSTTDLRDGLPSHCGIYAGNGKLIHCTRSKEGVVEQDLNNLLEVYGFIGARRIL
jgi:cell wall-associated NlpC family hydrolase